MARHTEIPTSLTSRQWNLYNLIKHNSLVEHRKTTQQEICEKIADFKYRDREHTSDKCPTIWEDIEAINLFEGIDKCVITKRYEYWIGSEQESIDYLKHLWKNNIAPRLNRYHALSKKLKLNDQYMILNHNGRVINYNEGEERVVDVFNPYPIESKNDC